MDNILNNLSDFATAFGTGTSMNDVRFKKQQQLMQLDEQRKGAIFKDARMVNSYLKAGQLDQAANSLTQRAEFIQQLGGDPSDTLEVLSMIQAGDTKGAMSLLDSVEMAGVKSGYLTDPRLTEAAISGKQKTPAPSEVEKNFNKLSGLRQQLSAAENSGDPLAIEAAKQQIQDFRLLSGKFGESAQQKSDIKVKEAANKKLSEQAAIASKEAFDGLKTVRSSIGNMTDAIKAIKKGADTGPIISKLPSFREASIELDNIRGKMGLDVVGATTFGALSESELSFALDVALPNNLEEAALSQWLTRKRDAQRKLGKELMRAATFLGKPGNTIAKYIEQEQASGKLSFEPVAGEDDKVDEASIFSKYGIKR